jgi:phosphate transport system substrate-binding protein
MEYIACIDLLNFVKTITGKIMRIRVHTFWRNMICTVMFFSFAACSSRKSKSPTDTPTSGEINIAIDETLAPVMQSEVEVFESIYRYAKLNPRYLPEGDAFKSLLLDSSRLIIAGRTLSPEEKKYFEQIRITPRTTKIAVDGVALIVHPENTDTSLSFAAVRDIFLGKLKTWKEINPRSSLGEIKIVFDNKVSGTAHYIRDSVIGGAELPSNCFASNGNNQLIDYVSNDRNTIGVIGVNFISDKDDPSSLSFLRKIRVVGISPREEKAGVKEYYKPYQAYLALKQYPLWRDIFIISREARTGLGTGFMSFVAGDKGQRIILKSGLVPATVPVRLVDVKNR